MEYFLMNKNTPLLKFETKYSLGSIMVKQTDSFSSVRPIGFKDIADWVDKRDYAKHKKHLSNWLKEWGIDTTDGFLQISHCLGINDTLWVKEINSELRWEDVSLYQNPFTDVVSKTAFDSGLYGLHLKTTSPEFTNEGSFLKYWTFEDDGIYLYKFGSYGFANAGQEPYSEYFASVISQLFQKDSVCYDLDFRHNRICSRCKLFTDESEGFVPIYKLLDDKNYSIAELLEFCSSMGFETEFRKMILIDSVIFNQDRHLGNFGFIVDNDTFEIKRFAPLFDFNMSMLARAMDDDLDRFEQYAKEYELEHKLGGDFVAVGREIITPELRKELPRKLTLTQHPRYAMEDSRFQKLKTLFEENYAKILGSEHIRNSQKKSKKANEHDISI